MTQRTSSKPDALLALFDIEKEPLAEAIDSAALASGNYPYTEKLKRKVYEETLRLLQIELLKVQRWAHDQGQRIIIVFEGRDAAGKGGTIKRFAEHLNPRSVKLVALAKPTDAERGQWYFQRYVAHLPTTGEITLFDRSWYNRGGVERVMGFCSGEQVDDFFTEAPEFEKALKRDGIHLFKIWLNIGREMQLKRLHARQHDPLKRWKLSPIDLAAPQKWHDYTAAIADIMRHTHNTQCPWTVVRANDKKRARINVIRHVLSQLDYAEKDAKIAGQPDPKIVLTGADFLNSETG